MDRSTSIKLKSRTISTRDVKKIIGSVPVGLTSTLPLEQANRTLSSYSLVPDPDRIDAYELPVAKAVTERNIQERKRIYNDIVVRASTRSNLAAHAVYECDTRSDDEPEPEPIRYSTGVTLSETAQRSVERVAALVSSPVRPAAEESEGRMSTERLFISADVTVQRMMKVRELTMVLNVAQGRLNEFQDIEATVRRAVEQEEMDLRAFKANEFEHKKGVIADIDRRRRELIEAQRAQELEMERQRLQEQHEREEAKRKADELQAQQAAQEKKRAEDERRAKEAEKQAALEKQKAETVVIPPTKLSELIQKACHKWLLVDVSTDTDHAVLIGGALKQCNFTNEGILDTARAVADILRKCPPEKVDNVLWTTIKRILAPNDMFNTWYSRCMCVLALCKLWHDPNVIFECAIAAICTRCQEVLLGCSMDSKTVELYANWSGKALACLLVVPTPLARPEDLLDWIQVRNTAGLPKGANKQSFVTHAAILVSALEVAGIELYMRFGAGFEGPHRDLVRSIHQTVVGVLGEQNPSCRRVQLHLDVIPRYRDPQYSPSKVTDPPVYNLRVLMGAVQ